MVENGGFIEMTQGIETLVILALNGGNDSDDGSAATENMQWWGNDGEPPDRVMRSEFHAMVNGGAVTSARIADLRDAAQRDIDRDLIDSGVAQSATVKARLSTPKRLELFVQILLFSGQNVTMGLEVAV